MTVSIGRARPRRRHHRAAAAVLAAVALTGSLGACSRWRKPGPPPTGPGHPVTTAAPKPRPANPAPANPAPANPASAGWQAEMLAAVNAERAKAGLQPMQSCGTLNTAAQSYAEDMARRGVLTHYGADGSTPAQRERAAGYVAAPGQRYMYGAENIAMGYPNVQAVMTGWMNSKGHRDNILAEATNHIGMGRQGNYWVQNFGTGGVC